MLKQHCGDCHDSQNEEGNLNLDRLVGEFPLVKNRGKWANVIEQLKNRVMPPTDSNEMSNGERQRLVGVLHREIHLFDYGQIDDPGFEPVRRLTHEQYNNSIRDLFGYDLRPADKFPQDLSGTSGFDNSANTLFIQPLLMEQYLSAAEDVTVSFFRKAQGNVWSRLTGKETDSPKDDDQAEQIVAAFAQRAFRRPVTADERDRILSVFRRSRRMGRTLADAASDAVQVVLISPGFLFHAESQPNSTALNKDAAQVVPVSGRDLANRLAYFLWASMPDDNLTSSASETFQFDPVIANPAFDRIRQANAQAESIRKQLDRMLSSPKANTLGTIFAAQWLGFDNLGKRVRADPIDNPWCTDSLMNAMKAESAMFFMSVLRENRSIADLVDSDYTFLNDELAKHYRISGIRGKEMRRVQLEKTSPRGGIFGQGSLLAVTSFPGRTSPVIRGHWILADVLGTPPPPPPPNASDIADEIAEKRGLTRKQKLELHRSKANCFACHSQMDPLGFSLERFDWFGRWRSRGDDEAQLPNGKKFKGPIGLKRVIIENRLDDLTTQLARKMLSYALGRQLEYYDERTVRQLVERVKADGYRLKRLVEEVALSYPFRCKKTVMTE